MLTELLASFIEVDSIRQHYKSRLVGCVLNGYLSLRKLVVQRTKLVDETQEKLLNLLEEMTTGEVTRLIFEVHCGPANASSSETINLNIFCKLLVRRSSAKEIESLSLEGLSIYLAGV